MRNILVTLTATLALSSIAAPVALAQSGTHMASDHMMATPDELKWVDIPSLPPERSSLSSKVRSIRRGR